MKAIVKLKCTKPAKHAEHLRDMWEQGRDFYSPATRYCSVRDWAVLDDMYDRIELVSNDVLVVLKDQYNNPIDAWL